MASNLATARNDFSESSWLSACKPYLASLMDELEAERVAAEFMKKVAAIVDGPEEQEVRVKTASRRRGGCSNVIANPTLHRRTTLPT